VMIFQIDYAYIYDRVTTNRAIRLVIVNFENVDIVKASDGVYVLLDNDVSSSSPSASHVISPSSHVTSSTPSLASSLVSGRSLSSNNLNGSSLTISSLEMDRVSILKEDRTVCWIKLNLPQSVYIRAPLTDRRIMGRLQ